MQRIHSIYVHMKLINLPVVRYGKRQEEYPLDGGWASKDIKLMIWNQNQTDSPHLTYSGFSMLGLAGHDHVPR